MSERKESVEVQRAIDILQSGDASFNPQELFDLSKQLKSQNSFNYARQLLRKARGFEKELKANPDLTYRIEQQYALCTYKDQDLTVEFRLDAALKILRDQILNLEVSTDPETLGYAGAIYKRKWEAIGDKNLLISALHYYRRGHEYEKGMKDGYPGINAAFIADNLAKLETDSELNIHPDLERANSYTSLAQSIRSELVKSLQEGIASKSIDKNWWVLVTLTEAYFGLLQFDQAQIHLDEAVALKNVALWEYETTIRQLTQLAILQTEDITQIMDGPAGEVIKVLAGANRNSNAILETAITGKIGLALSGGGFRAALFHIGLLAKLAEQDILRQVEVISCVSGGSIIGTCYYLAIKDELEKTPDSKISVTTYTAIVKKLEIEFLTGVQKNLRMCIFTNWWANVKMFLTLHYTRTLRLGELYEEELFRKFSGKKKHILQDLIINPVGEPEDFKPKYNNWYRKAKVPILIINATTLNTGHNWQFTGSWMGEPPFGISSIDGNYRLRRLYHDQQTSVKPIRLGHAVAASSCVPALFPPLEIRKIYPDIGVKLVDGGVHDNQGTSSLIEQGCTVLLVSDASGQMNSENDPSSNTISVILRSNDILMERVRNAQFLDLQMRLRSKLLRGLMFIHLKSELDVKSISWTGAPLLPKPVYNPMTNYQVEKNVQRLLAGVRTDLDSFHNYEANSLMKDAYQMSEWELNNNNKLFSTKGRISPAPVWQFNVSPITLNLPTTEMNKLLLISASKLFKVFKLRTFHSSFIAVAILSIVSFGVKKIFDNWFYIPIDWLNWIMGIVGGFVIGITAFTLTMNLYVHLLDRIYRNAGK